MMKSRAACQIIWAGVIVLSSQSVSTSRHSEGSTRSSLGQNGTRLKFRFQVFETLNVAVPDAFHPWPLLKSRKLEISSTACLPVIGHHGSGVKWKPINICRYTYLISIVEHAYKHLFGFVACLDPSGLPDTYCGQTAVMYQSIHDFVRHCSFDVCKVSGNGQWWFHPGSTSRCWTVSCFTFLCPRHQLHVHLFWCVLRCHAEFRR